MSGGKTDWAKGIFFLIFFLCIVVGAGLLKIMEEVTKPVVLSVFMSFIFFTPIKKLNEKFRVPWWLGMTIVFIVFFAFFFGIGNIILASFKSILDKAPEYEERFNTISMSIHELISKNRDSKLFELLKIDKDQTIAQYFLQSFDIIGTVKNFAVGFTGFVLNF
ncbi:MAG: AI-2E family transporter [Treponema sp.]|nr:AI-2E family transporter [Treponema sp.]